MEQMLGIWTLLAAIFRKEVMLYGSGQGRYQAEFQELWNRLVPVSHEADTLQGELLRVTGNLASEFYRNGNCNWSMRFRKYTNVLYKHLRDVTVFSPDVISEIEADIADIRGWGNGTREFADCLFRDGEDTFDRVTDRVVEWCLAHPDLIPYVNRQTNNPKSRL